MFYSSNSSLMLGIFQHKVDGSMLEASFKVSTTRCKYIEIDPCFLEMMCDNKETTCKRYLENVTRSSNITFSYKYSVLSLSHMEESCSVLQIATTLTLSYHQYVNFIQSKYPELCQLFITQVKGLGHIYHVIMSSYMMWPTDMVLYQAAIVRDCRTIENTTLHCLRKISEIEVQRLTHLKWSNSKHIHTMRHVKMTSDIQLIEEVAYFSYQSNNWIHIFIEKVHSVNKKTLELFAKDFIPRSRNTDIDTALSEQNTVSTTLIVAVDVAHRHLGGKEISFYIKVMHKFRGNIFTKLLGWINEYNDKDFAHKILFNKINLC